LEEDKTMKITHGGIGMEEEGILLMRREVGAREGRMECGAGMCKLLEKCWKSKNGPSTS
jgi:hypothetical protein